MKISFPKPAQFLALRTHSPLVPHGLCTCSAGLFSVSVVDSSVIPLPCLAALTCCCYGWWRTAEILGCWFPVLL